MKSLLFSLMARVVESAELAYHHAAGVVTRNPTQNPRGLDAWGHYHMSPFSYIGPTIYAAGGDAQTAQAFKLGVVEHIPSFIGVTVTGVTAVIYQYNPTTSKMQAFWSTTGAPAALVEVADATDLSGYAGNGMAFGKG